MKKLITITSIILSLTACVNPVNEEKQNESKISAENSTSKPSVAKDQLAMKKDPVCGMPAYKFMKDTTIFKGKIYGFCGKGCKDDFLKNPEKYIH